MVYKAEHEFKTKIRFDYNTERNRFDVLSTYGFTRKYNQDTMKNQEEYLNIKTYNFFRLYNDKVPFIVFITSYNKKNKQTNIEYIYEFDYIITNQNYSIYILKSNISELKEKQFILSEKNRIDMQINEVFNKIKNNIIDLSNKDNDTFLIELYFFIST